jgi:hypothetical protein
MPPICIPPETVPPIIVRLRPGEYSLLSAITFGIEPPMPTPMKKRSSPKVTGPFVKPVNPMQMLNREAHRMIVFLRPIRSASEPNTSAPTAAPISA